MSDFPQPKNFQADSYAYPQAQEKRIAPDGQPYTKDEFMGYFGHERGASQWNTAAPHYPQGEQEKHGGPQYDAPTYYSKADVYNQPNPMDPMPSMTAPPTSTTNLVPSGEQKGAGEAYVEPPNNESYLPPCYADIFGPDTVAPPLLYFSPEQQFQMGFAPPPPNYYENNNIPAPGPSEVPNTFEYDPSTAYPPSMVPISQEEKIKPHVELSKEELQDLANSKLKYEDMKMKSTKKGMESSDMRITNQEEILKFFQYNNSAPTLSANVEGYHYETRYRTVSYTDADGNTQQRLESYEVKVTDFDYDIPMSDQVIPYGYMQGLPAKKGKNKGKPRTCMECIDEFQQSENKMKSLRMNKIIEWDYSRARSLIVNRIRNLGYYNSVSVTFHNLNYRVVLRTPFSEASAQCWFQCLCAVTCCCIFFYPFKKLYSVEEKMVSVFRMNSSVDEWFDRYGRDSVRAY
eukprot:Pgem_evm1s893